MQNKVKDMSREKKMKKDPQRFVKIKKHHKNTYETALKNGKMDPQLIELCGHIADTKKYFTSSGCAGRVMLLDSEYDEEKKAGLLYRTWHEKVSQKEMETAIKMHNGKGLWFKLEPFILHLGCETNANAKKIILLKEKCGIRRGGITSFSNGKIIVELVGTKYMSFPIKQNGKKICGKKFLKVALETANKKLETNYQKLALFTKELKKNLK
jgi:tRNA wybutosine-synthesizing protein 3